MDTRFFPEDIVRAAVGGCCHDFAVALHRRTGWPIASIWKHPIEDGYTIVHEPIPVHVFCIAPDGRGIDVEGTRGTEELRQRYCSHAADLGRYRIEVHGNEKEWERAAEESGQWMVAVREHGVAAAEKVISESEGFVELVRELKENVPRVGNGR